MLYKPEILIRTILQIPSINNFHKIQQAYFVVTSMHFVVKSLISMVFAVFAESDYGLDYYNVVLQNTTKSQKCVLYRFLILI